jgi:hypothetical protein
VSGEPKVTLIEIDDRCYRSEAGHVLAREDVVDEHENRWFGVWVYRTPDGTFVDKDQYRYDLGSRYKLELVHPR